MPKNKNYHVGEDLSKHALHGFCTRVGFPRVSGLCYETMRGLLHHFMEGFIQKIVAHTTHADKKTITINEVYPAMHTTVFVTKKDMKRCHDKAGREQICLGFSKAPFDRIIRHVVSYYKENLRIEEAALTLIQYYVEMWLLKLLSVAKKLMREEKVQTLQHNHLDTAGWMMSNL